jgi:RHS repeat-associated protein
MMISSSSSAAVPGTNVTLTAQYLLNLGGEQVTELNGTGGWVHSNVWAGSHLDATYDTKGLHFQLADPLGTRRVQTNYQGVVEEYFQSLPFGDNLNPVIPSGAPATADDATEHHFTGKERDSESGNDYFGARYYASAVGRWLSPDWSAKQEPVPYVKLDDPQTLNLYEYVENNPLGFTDADGHMHQQCHHVGATSSSDANGNIKMTTAHDECDSVPDWYDLALAFHRFGRRGGPMHRNAVRRIMEREERLGREVQDEAYIKTPNGAKPYRFADVRSYDPKTGETRFFQAGKTLADNKTPVPREVQAMDDIQGAKGIRPQFVDYETPAAQGYTESPLGFAMPAGPLSPSAGGGTAAAPAEAAPGDAAPVEVPLIE